MLFVKLGLMDYAFEDTNQHINLYIMFVSFHELRSVHIYSGTFDDG
jgi:hypothetical protein